MNICLNIKLYQCEETKIYEKALEAELKNQIEGKHIFFVEIKCG